MWYWRKVRTRIQTVYFHESSKPPVTRPPWDQHSSFCSVRIWYISFRVRAQLFSCRVNCWQLLLHRAIGSRWWRVGIWWRSRRLERFRVNHHGIVRCWADGGSWRNHRNWWLSGIWCRVSAGSSRGRGDVDDSFSTISLRWTSFHERQNVRSNRQL